MPKIDFYVLSESKILPFACRLIEKVYKQNHRIYIHTENVAYAHEIDELLWTYRDDSFLPHNLYGEGPEPPPPIQIGANVEPQRQWDVLLNLGQTVPAFYTKFFRILELIADEPKAQEAGRARYRFYRSLNFSINTHKIINESHHGKNI